MAKHVKCVITPVAAFAGVLKRFFKSTEFAGYASAKKHTAVNFQASGNQVGNTGEE